MTTETSNAQGEWPERYACNGPEGAFWTDDAALANKLIAAAFDRDEWTVTDTQNPTAAPPPAAARGDVRGLVALAEQMERDAAGCRRDGYIDAAVVKEECAQRIRQTLGISAIAEALAAECVQAGEVADAEVWLFKGTDGVWRTFHNEQHRLDTIADGRWEVRKFYARTPPPAAAEPKTLPVPTRVYLIGETAVIAGYPQRGWDEEGPDAHNCDDMGCPTFGRHVLARVPFTDERAMSQPAEAQAQDGGEVVAWAVVGNKSGEILNVFHGTREKWLADTKYWPDHGFRTRPLVYGDTAPPSAPVGTAEDMVLDAIERRESSAPVGVEDVVMAARNAENAIRNCAAAGQIGEGYVQYADDLRDAVQRLAQQPAAVDGAVLP